MANREVTTSGSHLANALVTPTGAATDVTLANVAQVALSGMRTTDTIASLTAISSPAANQLVYVRGYYTPGDGGEGVFRWHSTSSATEDTGTVIGPLAGGQGRWIRMFANGVYNVKWFASAAYAFDAANNASIGLKSLVLYFPAGSYDIGNVTVATRLGIQGDCEKTLVSGNIKFEGGSRNLPPPVKDVCFIDTITLENCRNRLFQNVMFYNTVVFSSVNFCHYNTFHHCQWILADPAIQSGPGGENNFNKIINCKILIKAGAVTPALKLESGSGWNIIGNSLEMEYNAAEPYVPMMDIDGGSHLIAGNWFERSYVGDEEGLYTTVILRGSGITFHIGNLPHWMLPIEDIGNSNQILGAVNRTSGDPDYRDKWPAQRIERAQVETDGSGNVTLKHRLFREPKVALANVMGTTNLLAHLISTDSTNIVFRVTDISGNPVQSGTIDIRYFVGS